MLQHLRDNSKGVVSGILIGLLVIIFTLSGAEALFSRDASTRSVVEVNGEKISETDIARAIETQKQQMLARYGDSVPAEFLTDEYLRGPVIENLIERNLVLQAAEKGGMVAGEERLNQQIISTPQFQQENGSFDPNRYQSVLRNVGFTPSTYRKALADDLLANQLMTGVLNSSFVTSAELKEVVALSYQTRDFSYVILPAEKVREKVTIEDSEVQAYYDTNAQDFTNPEQVAVDYIELSVEGLMEAIDVSEEEVRKQYEQNLAAFVASPQHQAAHILIESNDEKVIAEVAGKLAAGEDFAELALAYSDDLGSRELGGDLGFTTGDTFPEAFESALADLTVGSVSAPVKTDAGTHFIKKLAERGTEAPSFEEERVALANQLKRNQAENTFVDLLNQLRELSYNAENLADVASDLALPLQNTGLFSRVSGSGIAEESSFVTAAFSSDVLTDGNSSDVIELTPSRVVVLKKTDFKTSYVSELDAVKEQIVTTIRERKTRELLAEQANQLEREINAGKTLDEVAALAGVEVVSIEKASRNDPKADIDALRHVFTMAKPNSSTPVVDAVQTNSGDFALIALTAVTLGGEALPEQQQQIIAAQLGGIIGQNENRSYQKLLRDSAEIKQ